MPTGTNNMGGQVDGNGAAIDRDVDASRPGSTITGVAYDSSNGTITLTGADFDQIEGPANDDIKAQLDWSKFTWDIDGDGATTAGLQFAS